MAKVDLDQLLNKCGSVYKLVLLASKRAKELAEGSKRLIETETRKVTTVVLEEIAAGKVSYKEEDPSDAPAKTGGKGKKKS